MADRGRGIACLLVAVAAGSGCARWLESWGRPVPRTPVVISGAPEPAPSPTGVGAASFRDTPAVEPRTAADAPAADAADLAASIGRIAELLGELDSVVEQTNAVRQSLLRVSHALPDPEDTGHELLGADLDRDGRTPAHDGPD